MKKIKVLCFFALLFSVISCDKDEIPTTGCADEVVGTYHGTMYHDGVSFPCTSQIIKTTDTKVKLTITINISSFTFGDIAVKNAGNNTYTLSYAHNDESDYLDGNVEGNTLTFVVNSGVMNDMFTGTR